MKNWMKMAAMLLAVTMMACGCSNGTAAPSDTPESTAEQTEAASEAETAGADEAAPEAEGEQVEVDLSAGLDEEGNVLDMDTKDYLTLPDYKTVTFADADVHPNEDQIQQQVDTLMSNYADKVEVKDRKVEDGDTVNIDYVGSVDGVEFEGGNTNGGGATVVAGTKMYIDDFLDQIIGHEPGETFDVNVTFPDPYESNPDLSGKEAVFVTTINFIQEEVLPELTDDFVKEHFEEEFKLSTVDALKEKITSTLSQTMQNEAAWNYLRENVTFTQSPEAMIDILMQEYEDSIVLSAQQYGIEVEEMLGYYGMGSIEELREYYRPSAEDLAKQYLIAQAICDEEQMAADEAAMERYFEGADYSSYVESMGMGYVKMQVKFRLVSEKLMEYANIQ